MAGCPHLRSIRRAGDGLLIGSRSSSAECSTGRVGVPGCGFRLGAPHAQRGSRSQSSPSRTPAFGLSNPITGVNEFRGVETDVGVGTPGGFLARRKSSFKPTTISTGVAHSQLLCRPSSGENRRALIVRAVPCTGQRLGIGMLHR
jgi:hypothetical protein